MSWFRVDDHLHSHSKAIRAGTEAMGLWILAGSWAAAEESDGWVPGYMLQRLAGGGADALAERLVRAGLWEEAEREGDAGYVFHQWEEHQPTRAQLEAKREQARERMRRARTQGGDVRANSEGTSRAVTPTRPDPTRPIEERPRKRATQLPADFTPNDTNRRIAEERGLDLAAVVAQWSDFHTAKGSTFKDWHAALNTWLRREQPSMFPTRQTAPAGPRPATLRQCDGTACPGNRHQWHDARNQYLCQGA